MSTIQPVWFIGHGSPMNALADNPFTASLNTLGASIAPPKAILVISAHWLTRGITQVQASPMPETIHDFGGFPRALHEFQYPAPGSPETAKILASGSQKIQETTEWGLDHGAWSVLCHLFPNHNIPCFEMSIDYSQPLAYHVTLAQELQFMRERGVLIVGSGNIVHNLQASIPNLSMGQEHFAYDWAQEILAKSPTSIKMLKFAMNLTDDGMVGQQVFAGEATRLAYMTEEAQEGRNAFLEKRKPNFKKIKWIP